MNGDDYVFLFSSLFVILFGGWAIICEIRMINMKEELKKYKLPNQLPKSKNKSDKMVNK
jgi:hypothetical protein